VLPLPRSRTRSGRLSNPPYQRSWVQRPLLQLWYGRPFGPILPNSSWCHARCRSWAWCSSWRIRWGVRSPRWFRWTWWTSPGHLLQGNFHLTFIADHDMVIYNSSPYAHSCKQLEWNDANNYTVRWSKPLRS
jgi:hypothetical protein